MIALLRFRLRFFMIFVFYKRSNRMFPRTTYTLSLPC